jgi:hypothetical protein
MYILIFPLPEIEDTVFENELLRRIFGPKREEAAGSWRKLCNQRFHNWYLSPNIIRVIKQNKMEPR